MRPTFPRTVRNESTKVVKKYTKTVFIYIQWIYLHVKRNDEAIGGGNQHRVTTLPKNVIGIGAKINTSNPTSCWIFIFKLFVSFRSVPELIRTWRPERGVLVSSIIATFLHVQPPGASCCVGVGLETSQFRYFLIYQFFCRAKCNSQTKLAWRLIHCDAQCACWRRVLNRTSHLLLPWSQARMHGDKLRSSWDAAQHSGMRASPKYLHHASGSQSGCVSIAGSSAVASVGGACNVTTLQKNNRKTHVSCLLVERTPTQVSVGELRRHWISYTGAYYRNAFFGKRNLQC